MLPSEPIAIRRAGPGDMDRLAVALAHLSADLGDCHHADTATLTAACSGPHPACHGLLALDGGRTVGAALISPLFSTTIGAAGVYVSDLWVDADQRGTGLGRRLLTAAAGHARDLWSARFLKLAVYDDNPSARAFYDRLGFRHRDRDRILILDSPAFASLLEPA